MALDFEIILKQQMNLLLHIHCSRPFKECCLFNSADLVLPECFSNGLSCWVVEFDCYNVGDNMLIYITIST